MDVLKNMTYPQIVAAIAKIEASGWNLHRELVGINAWQLRQKRCLCRGNENKRVPINNIEVVQEGFFR